MSYSEFELIRRCFVDEGLGFDRDGVVLGIGDDAAIVQPPNGMAIALSLDTLVEGVHFLKPVSYTHLTLPTNREV